ncbi:MAG: class I SAM-dependent methyltransferase [Planctomycetota bacterium]|jgi:SAM-dependent methyltransferase
MAEIEGAHWWFVARRRILREAIRRLVPLPPGARLLEAGCGTGGNLAMLGTFGEVLAFEPDVRARELASCKTAIRPCEGRLPSDVPFEAGAFDLVVALDVLEHLDDDLAGLKALRSRLRPGGWMLITVPAFAFLWSHHDVVHHHKRRYRKEALVRLALAAGLPPVTATYFNTLLFPLVAVVRFVKNLLGIKSADDGSMPAPLLNGLLRIVFACERHMVGRIALPIGVSILMIVRRPGP